MILLYKKWYVTKLYKKVVSMGLSDVKEVSYPKDVVCDGWFLFGHFCLYQRENTGNA